MSLEKIIYPELPYNITGILFIIHNNLGRYCNEKQYCDAIEMMFNQNGIIFVREKILPQSFEAELIGRNRVDFLIEDKIILEVKSKRFLTREDYYQSKRYLTALNKRLALLVNFRSKYLVSKRILNSLA